MSINLKAKTALLQKMGLSDELAQAFLAADEVRSLPMLLEPELDPLPAWRIVDSAQMDFTLSQPGILDDLQLELEGA